MEKDLIIENEVFKTYSQYRLLADKIWLHNSIGWHVTIENCTFYSEVLHDFMFVKELNEIIGFDMFYSPLLMPRPNLKSHKYL